MPNVFGRSTWNTCPVCSFASMAFTWQMLYACRNMASMPLYAYSSLPVASVLQKSGFACNHGLLPLAGIYCISAVISVDRNIHHRAVRLFDPGAIFFQLFCDHRAEVPAPGLNLANIEFARDVR